MFKVKIGMNVTYPNGRSVLYKEATFLELTDKAWILRTKQYGPWVAHVQISAGVTVTSKIWRF